MTKWSTRLEGGCPACSVKHLSNALVILEQDPQPNSEPLLSFQVEAARASILAVEAELGYPGHRYLACGILSILEQGFIVRGEKERAELVRIHRLDYAAGKHVCWDTLVIYLANEDRRTARNAYAGAELMEAMLELPSVDTINREKIRKVLPAAWPDNPELVKSITECLKAVVDTYELEVNHG